MKEKLTDCRPNIKGEKFCKICDRKLRPLTKSKDWDSRCYHVTCFRDLVTDIYNFDKIAYKKYNHKKKVGTKSLDEFINGKEPIIINFN
tara:strand:+ start:232 stop:498 length:267 start_codon:yes stop_codon:yes gene_type:complete